MSLAIPDPFLPASPSDTESSRLDRLEAFADDASQAFRMAASIAESSVWTPLTASAAKALADAYRDLARLGDELAKRGAAAALVLAIVLLGATPARADFGELCKATPLDCYVLVPAEDHEAICGKALTFARAKRMTARMARRAASYLDRGNVACASELLEELIPAFMRSWPKAAAPNPPTFPRTSEGRS